MALLRPLFSGPIPNIQVDVIERSRATTTLGSTLYLGELRCLYGQCVVHSWIEILELIDPVEYVGDELLEEHSRCDADSAPKCSGHCISQGPDVGIINCRA